MRLACLLAFGVVTVAFAQQPVAIENLFPEQLPRGQTTAVNVAIQSREVFTGADVSPGVGVTIARVENARPPEDSQGVAWWRVTITVAPDAAPGPRSLTLLTAAGRTLPAAVVIPTHVPIISDLKLLPSRGNQSGVNLQFAASDASGDLGDHPYVWFSVDCGIDPSVGVVRGTVNGGVVHAALPVSLKPADCGLRIRASDRGGVDSNTLMTRIN